MENYICDTNLRIWQCAICYPLCTVTAGHASPKSRFTAFYCPYIYIAAFTRARELRAFWSCRRIRMCMFRTLLAEMQLLITIRNWSIE